MKKKLLTKDEILLAGKAFNYYTIMDEYLSVMPFTQKERSEVKLALTTKIEYALAKQDFKPLDKRMKQLMKEIDRRKKLQKKEEIIDEDEFFREVKSVMFRRDGQ